MSSQGEVQYSLGDAVPSLQIPVFLRTAGASEPVGRRRTVLLGSTVPQPQLVRELRVVYAQIDSCLELEEDWDGEDSLPPTPEAVRVAKSIWSRVSESVARTGGHACPPPVVGPTGDGGMMLSWEVGGKRLLLLIRALRGERIVCVLDVPPADPVRSVRAESAAAGLAAEALAFPK